MTIKILDPDVLDRYILNPPIDDLTRHYLSDLELISSRLRGLLAVEIHNDAYICIRAADVLRLLEATVKDKMKGGAGDGNQEE